MRQVKREYVSNSRNTRTWKCGLVCGNSSVDQPSREAAFDPRSHDPNLFVPVMADLFNLASKATNTDESPSKKLHLASSIDFTKVNDTYEWEIMGICHGWKYVQEKANSQVGAQEDHVTYPEQNTPPCIVDLAAV